MALFRPTDLQEYLRSIGAKPIKALSQNFIIDGNILNKIIALAELSSDDFVVEIGPGPGALTEKLLDTGCSVLAIEKDPIFANALKPNPRLRVLTQDVLKVDFQEHIQGRTAKVVANLPYSITTPVLQKILLCENLFSSVTVMVQEEVAKKLCFEGAVVAFTHFLHYYAKPHYGFTVSPNCFYPAPRVHSAVMRLDVHKRYPVVDEKGFFELINAAFSERRKMMRSSLKSYPIEQALAAMGKPVTTRPEELSLAEWVQFYSTLSSLQTK